MNFIKRGKRLRFEPATLTESTAYLQNPSCGWYRIYPFALGEKPDFEELYWCLCAQETIVLALIDIGAFRDCRLSEEALCNLADILDFFANNHKEIILRITYDREGRGMQREPEFLDTVIGHMRQLGAVVRAHSEEILLVQGLLVGSWGEMHDSKFLSDERLKQLLRVWQEAVGNIAIAVRTPQQWRIVHPPNTTPGTDKIGLFNDGMFGSPDHLGTYGWQQKAESGWRGQWCREEEMEFTGRIAASVPYGGEAVGDSLELSFKEMAEELQRTHVSYLNSKHDSRRLQQWKETQWQDAGIWEQTSVFDYIGCHLGYRFVVREARLEGKKDFCLKIDIENTGFSTLTEEAELSLWLGKSLIVLPDSLCGMLPRETREITAMLPEKVLDSGRQLSGVRQKGEESACSLSLTLRRKRDKRPLFFANACSKDGSVLLGQLWGIGF